MISDELEKRWKSVTQAERDAATELAKATLANLVHYPITKRSYYDADVELLAATFIYHGTESDGRRRGGS